MSAPSQALSPPPIQSANCTSPLLARHEGSGMQTVLIMTFTVFTTVWAVKATLWSSGPTTLAWQYVKRMNESSTCPIQHFINRTLITPIMWRFLQYKYNDAFSINVYANAQQKREGYTRLAGKQLRHCYFNSETGNVQHRR